MMLTFAERLAIFTNWSHAVSSDEDLTDAEFSHQTTTKDPDTVVCQVCKTSLYNWEPDDDPMWEHPYRSRSCIRVSKTDSTIMMFVQKAAALPKKDSQASRQEDSQASSQASSQEAPPQEMSQSACRASE